MVYTYDQIKVSIEETLDLTKEVTKETITQAVAEVAKKAEEYLGPGVFVKAWLTSTELLFTFKRPTLGIREYFAFPLSLSVDEESQEDKSKRKRKTPKGDNE